MQTNLFVFAHVYVNVCKVASDVLQHHESGEFVGDVGSSCELFPPLQVMTQGSGSGRVSFVVQNVHE